MRSRMHILGTVASTLSFLSAKNLSREVTVLDQVARRPSPERDTAFPRTRK